MNTTPGIQTAKLLRSLKARIAAWYSHLASSGARAVVFDTSRPNRFG